MARFWTQTQAPSGNWTDDLGSDDVDACIEWACHKHEQGKAARVIERTDRVLTVVGVNSPTD